MPILLLLVFFGVSALVAYAAWHLEWRRRKLLRWLAHRLGLKYLRESSSVIARYGELDVVRRGHRPVARNVLVGRFEGHPVCVFDLCTTSPSGFAHGSQQRDHPVTLLVLEHEGHFPELWVHPEDPASMLSHLLGYEDIAFESVAFSDAFYVRSADRKFAYDVCHPRMMQYMLRHQDVWLDFVGSYIAVRVGEARPERLLVKHIPRRLQELVEIRNLLPAYLFDDVAEERG